MPSSAGRLGGTGAAETSSPELVLVDDRLAIRARERLEEPDDTLARLEHEIWLNRLASLEAAANVDEATRSREWHSAFARSTRIVRRATRTKAAAAAAIAAALMVALLLGVNVNLRSTPAGADSDKIDRTTIGSTGQEKAAREKARRRRETAGRAPSTRRESTNRPLPDGAAATRKLDPRRFAWAPVPDASGYHIEFFRKAVRIYSGDTADPQMALPSTWTSNGRKHQLTNGTYRWYVWPIVSGLRQSQATVQAELVVR